jgi:hypothetical protein
MAQRSLYDLINGENASGNPDLAEDAANSQAVIAKQRFVYNGTGRTVDTNIWTSRSIYLTAGSTVMGNDGLEIRSHTGTGISKWQIDLNNKRQFDVISCAMIASVIRSEAEPNGSSLYAGIGNDSTANDQSDHMACIVYNATSTPIKLQVQNAPSYATTSSSTMSHARPFTFKLESAGSSAQKMSLDGTLAVTTSVTMVSTKVCPFFKHYKRDSYDYSSHSVLRYCEAYST